MEQHLCMGCMHELPEGEAACPHCGYPVGGVNPGEYLPVRTVLSGRYLVGRVLEISGDSAVYIGYDQQEKGVITLREFFPRNMSIRRGNGELVAIEGKEEMFAVYRAKFLSVARAVARLRDLLVVVPSYDIFAELGTAYTVSEFCEGVSLEKYVAEQGGRLPADEVRRLFMPFLEALSTIHETGMLHLGISPKNILVDAEGMLRLKNFSIPETRTVNTECEPHLIGGYAAPEQYEEGAECLPSADVYGVAATMFFALTGRHPTEANKRGKKANDLMMPADVEIPDHIRDSLLRALRVNPQRRTQAVDRLLSEITATSAVAALIREEEEDEEETPKNSTAKYLWITFVAVFVLLAVLAVFALNALDVFRFPWQQGAETSEPTEEPTLSMDTATTTTKPGELTFTVTNLVGRVYSVAKQSPVSGQMEIVLKGFEYSDMEAGVIVSQSPAAGERATQGAIIEVVVSIGSSETVMPNLIGWKEEHARTFLEAMGYTVSDTLWLQGGSDFGLEAGCVERTDPKPGEPIAYGDKVVLSVVEGSSSSVEE